MEEIYSIADCRISRNVTDIHGSLRCFTLYNNTYDYDRECISEEFTDDLRNWKSIFVASLSESDNEEQLRKVFKFFGIISKIEIHRTNAIVYYDNWYHNEFVFHLQRELERKKEIDDCKNASICLVYTVWQSPIIPLTGRTVEAFEENYLVNHKEIEHIRIYDVYMMPEGFTFPPPNYENTCKLYQTACYYKKGLARRIEETVREKPVDIYMDEFYGVGFSIPPLA